MKKCCVIGLGYIGLPTSIIAASNGFEVIGVDTNLKVIDDLNRGIIHIAEPNLQESFNQLIKKNVFKAQSQPSNADIFIIAVPTPFKKESNKFPTPDISYILDAVNSIIPFLKESNLVILESTSPVGTTEIIAEMIFNESKLDRNNLKIAYCPERVLPGNILNEIKKNDRVIGGINQKSSKAAKDFYSKFCVGKFNITDAKTAELVKLTENSFRDVNIAFANELSIISSNLGINYKELIKIANCHPRVNILTPSPGVGGHCIAVDPWFIVSRLPKESKLIKTAREVNKRKTIWVIEKIISICSDFEDKNNKKPKVGCFGLTFKPDVDDIRESSAIEIINKLIEKKIDLLCCDPMVKAAENLRIESANYLIEKCDIYIFLVAHTQFKSLNLNESKVIDFCGISDQ